MTAYAESHHAWKGNHASSDSIHKWVLTNWGKPDHCEICSTKTAKRYEWCNKDHTYDRGKREDWMQLCPSCHRRYDVNKMREAKYGAWNNCKQGHIGTMYRCISGIMICRQCGSESRRRRIARIKEDRVEG